MSTNPPGKLIIKPQAAKLKHKTDLFKMDPYVKVVLGEKYRKTHSKFRGGKNPTWDDKLELKRHSEEIIIFEVWDKDYLSSDDLIGQGE